MTTADPELGIVRELVDFAGLRVLEIGAGDGRLTWPFAPEARLWVALDPDADEARAAADELKQRDGVRVRVSIGDARELAFPDGYFDLAFFTWSLC
jgi:ubiquinone/menaquinone biosynthesis C-methylase UbiE